MRGIQGLHLSVILMMKMTHIVLITVSPLLVDSLILETYIKGAAPPKSPNRLVDSIPTTDEDDEDDEELDLSMSERFRRTAMHSRRVNPKASEIQESSNLKELEERSDVSEDEISNGTILLPLLLMASGGRRIIADGESCETSSQSLDLLQRMRVTLTGQ